MAELKKAFEAYNMSKDENYIEIKVIKGSSFNDLMSKVLKESNKDAKGGRGGVFYPHREYYRSHVMCAPAIDFEDIQRYIPFERRGEREVKIRKNKLITKI